MCWYSFCDWLLRAQWNTWVFARAHMTGTIYGIFPGGEVCECCCFYWTKCGVWTVQPSREGGPWAGAGVPFMSEAVAGYCFSSCQPHLQDIFLNGYNTFYHKGILKMEQKLGGVAIPQSKTFTSELTGWSEQGTFCQACLSWPTGPVGLGWGPSLATKLKGSSVASTPSIPKRVPVNSLNKGFWFKKKNEGYLDSLPLRHPFMKKARDHEKW